MNYTNVGVGTKGVRKKLASDHISSKPMRGLITTEIPISLERKGVDNTLMPSNDEGAEEAAVKKMKRVVCERCRAGAGGEVVNRNEAKANAGCNREVAIGNR